jgi:hypothetical protein
MEGGKVSVWPEWISDDGRIRIINADCLDAMPTLEPAAVDCVAADLPYGTTACKWDTVIPFEPLWACYRHVAKRNAAIVLTASQPFTSALVMSNPKWFRYEWIWSKSRVTGFLDARRKPLKSHESVLVFASGLTTYNPQMLKGEKHIRGGFGKRLRSCDTYQPFSDESKTESDEFFPRSVVPFSSVLKPIHNNEKPVALMEYLIRTYTNEGELVLDNTMGSGTTGVACLTTNRRFIGIEKDPEIFQTAKERIQAEYARTSLLNGVPA